MIDLKKYYKIWLLSNTNPKHIKDEIDNKCVFPHLVDGAIYSFDVGFRKPDKMIYQKSCEIVNVNPGECIFIDDLKENVKGAKKIGLNGLHYTKLEKLENDLKLLGLIK
jgi:putative hydrolase of the HAD superfamily